MGWWGGTGGPILEQEQESGAHSSWPPRCTDPKSSQHPSGSSPRLLKGVHARPVLGPSLRGLDRALEGHSHTGHFEWEQPHSFINNVIFHGSHSLKKLRNNSKERRVGAPGRGWTSTQGRVLELRAFCRRRREREHLKHRSTNG